MAERISGTPSVMGTTVDSRAQELAPTAAATTAENPWPVRLLSNNMKTYIDRMSSVWIEGQIVEFNSRGKASYFTLRDTEAEVSLPIQVWASVLDRMEVRPQAGSRVVVNVKADFWTKAGRLTMRAGAIRPVGLGELLARIEMLRKQLGQEGLFAPEAKVPLPFLPGRIGLITGRNSDAEKDVVRNAHARWGGAEFTIRNTAVQGPDAVPQVIAALKDLDADPEIEVIVIARGGGSMEDLLPFSNEALIRAVAAARTPVVSAIGHEADRPILDEVADVRASTPTDAAKRVVPDVSEELRALDQARALMDRAMDLRLAAEASGLADIRSRPVLAHPESLLTPHVRDLADLVSRSQRAMGGLLATEEQTIAHALTQVRGLSPLHTLSRGYALVQDAAGAVIRDSDSLSAGDEVYLRFGRGTAHGSITEVHPEAGAAADQPGTAHGPTASATPPDVVSPGEPIPEEGTP